MTPMHKSITALAAAALLATVGYATAQSTDTAPVDTPAAQSADAPAPAANDSSAQMPQTTTDPVTGQTSTVTTDPATGQTTTTTTITDTSTQVIPAPPTGVVMLARPAGTVAPASRKVDGPFGMPNTVMTTGLTNGATRPSVGDHATPPIQPEPTTIAVTTERTMTTTSTPPAPAPEPVAAPQPVATPDPAPAPEPMPAPRADRN